MNKMVNRALLLVLMLGAPLMANAEKIGVVDMSTVFEQLPQREQIAQQLKTEFGDRMAKVQKMQQEMRTLLEKRQRDEALMSASQKTDLERKMEALQSEYQLKGKALDEDLRRRQSEEQNKLLVKVQKVITKIAQQEKYDLVLQRGAVVYATPNADISDKVVEALSKGK